MGNMKLSDVVKKRSVITIVFTAVLVLGLLPITVVFAPEWRVKVMDGDGRPVNDATINVTWDHYELFDKSRGSITQRSSAEGTAFFSRRETRTNAMFYLIAASANRVMSLLPHGGGAPVAALEIWADKKVQVFQSWHPGDPNVVTIEIRMQSCDVAPSHWSCDPKVQKMWRKNPPMDYESKRWD
jgi:hypothetical protein